MLGRVRKIPDVDPAEIEWEKLKERVARLQYSMDDLMIRDTPEKSDPELIV